MVRQISDAEHGFVMSGTELLWVFMPLLSLYS